MDCGRARDNYGSSMSMKPNEERGETAAGSAPSTFNAKKWRIERARGLKRTTSARKSQIHVQTLVANGMSIRSIGEVSGVAPGVISQLSRGLRKCVAVRTESAILSVNLDAVMGRKNPLGFVPNVGARRRIRALMAIGWRHSDLSPMVGFNTGTLNHQVGNWVSRAKHDAVKDVYDRLWNTAGPAPETSRARVRNAGYLPPLAWDEDTIDDPNYEPDPASETVGDGIDDEVEFLLESGSNRHEIARRLGYEDPKSLERWLSRHDRADLVRRLGRTEVA